MRAPKCEAEIAALVTFVEGLKKRIGPNHSSLAASFGRLAAVATIFRASRPLFLTLYPELLIALVWVVADRYFGRQVTAFGAAWGWLPERFFLLVAPPSA